MSIYKKVLLALASFAVISTANAAALKLGSVGFSGTTPTEVELPEKGEFSNEFYFTLQEGNSLQIGLASFFWGDTVADAPEIRLILSGAAGERTFTPFVSVDPDDDSFFAGLILTGLSAFENYNLFIEGSNAINLGETYTLQLAATSIPEPESAALLLTAFGLMGLVIRRNNKKSKEIA